MKTSHEKHEARRKEFHDKMKEIHPHREFITMLTPGSKTPHYIWLDHDVKDGVGVIK